MRIFPLAAWSRGHLPILPANAHLSTKLELSLLQVGWLSAAILAALRGVHERKNF